MKLLPTSIDNTTISSAVRILSLRKRPNKRIHENIQWYNSNPLNRDDGKFDMTKHLKSELHAFLNSLTKADKWKDVI